MWVMHDPGWREALLPTLACCTSTLYIHRTSQTSNHQNSGTFWHFTGQTLCTLSVKKTKLKRFVARILLSCAAYYASAEALFGTGQDSRDLGLEERGTDLTLCWVSIIYSLTKSQWTMGTCSRSPSHLVRSTATLSSKIYGNRTASVVTPASWCCPINTCHCSRISTKEATWVNHWTPRTRHSRGGCVLGSGHPSCCVSPDGSWRKGVVVSALSPFLYL
jgi:hypothetical protein